MAPHRLRPPRAGLDAHLSTRRLERATSLVARSASQHSTRSAKRCDGAHAHTEHTQCALSQCRAPEAPHAPVANGSGGRREQLIDRGRAPPRRQMGPMGGQTQDPRGPRSSDVGGPIPSRPWWPMRRAPPFGRDHVGADAALLSCSATTRRLVACDGSLETSERRVLVRATDERSI